MLFVYVLFTRFVVIEKQTNSITLCTFDFSNQLILVDELLERQIIEMNDAI